MFSSALISVYLRLILFSLGENAPVNALHCAISLSGSRPHFPISHILKHLGLA